MGIFRPRMYYKSIFDINYEVLKKKNIKVIIFDLDNTIMKVDEETPSNKVEELFNKLNKGFKVFIASNNEEDRVKNIGKKLDVHAFYKVSKPSKKIKKLLLIATGALMNSTSSQQGESIPGIAHAISIEL